MRDNIFRHKSGNMVDLPLLVPSFSSKGFGETTDKVTKVKYSETTNALQQFGNYLNESYLLSGYDLHHNHFINPASYYNDTSLIFLDSGGYELNPEFDSTEPKITPFDKLEFSIEDYLDVLDVLYKSYNDTPFVIANYDFGTKHKPLLTQIQKAREIFIKYPKWSNNFILKPHDNKRILHIDEIIRHMDELSDFDVIGVTEKELGKNLLDRLKAISKLRNEMDQRKIHAPIHIWGGLDPIITPLYFFAGADIFDGISWLRYTYINGMAVNRESYSILTGNISITQDHAIMSSINNNINCLQELATSLRLFASYDKPNFHMFEANSDSLEKAYNMMRARIPELKRFN